MQKSQELWASNSTFCSVTCNLCTGWDSQLLGNEMGFQDGLCPCLSLNNLISPKSLPLFPSFHCFPLWELHWRYLSGKRDCSYTPAEEWPSCPSGGAGRAICTEFLPTGSWRAVSPGHGAVLGMSADISEPTVPLCTGCTAQGITGAVTGVTPRF